MGLCHSTLEQEDSRTGDASHPRTVSRPPTIKKNRGFGEEAAPSETKYRPLDASKREIRLIHLTPARVSTLTAFGKPNYTCSPVFDDPIRCFFEYGYIEEIQPFHALSYTWEDDSLGEKFGYPYDLSKEIFNEAFVILDGQKTAVTRNLWAALWHYRAFSAAHLQRPDLSSERRQNMLHAGTPIWIDALCINQEDLAERNSQVKIMREIYRRARCVQVWLGPMTADVAAASELLAVWTTKMSDLSNIANVTTDDTKELGFILIRDPQLRVAWEALITLLSRKYWRRLWIVQEILSNQCLNILFGCSIISKDILLQMWIMVDIFVRSDAFTGSPFELQLIGTFSELAFPHDAYTIFKPDFRGFDLFDLFKRYRTQKCLDPRDKVYGLLGLAKPYEHIDCFEIDYSLSSDLLYKMTTAYIIKGSKSLDIFREITNKTCAQHMPSTLPSWVLNLEDERHRIYPDLTSGGCASGQTMPVVNFSQPLDILTARGFMLGTVDSIWPIAFANYDPDVVTMAIAMLINLALSLVRGSHSGKLVVPLHDMQPDYKSNRIEAIKKLRALYSLLFRHIKDVYSIRDVDPLSEEDFLNFCDIVMDCCPSTLSADNITSLRDRSQSKQLYHYLKHTTLFITSDTSPKYIDYNQYNIGKCYEFNKKGDIIAILYGCSSPIILRQVSNTPRQYKILGSIFFPGYENGEALGQFEEVDFEIT